MGAQDAGFNLRAVRANQPCPVGRERETGWVTVAELLDLAPVALGTVTIVLAAGALIFGHAYGRYGEDAAISFLLRWRFVVAAALVFAGPTLMLISFGRGSVPSWLTSERAAWLVGSGVAASGLLVAYLLLYVSRPGRFLGAVGKRVTVRRLNRYALAMRWRDRDEFVGDVAARRYRWFGSEFDLRSGTEKRAHPLRRARWTVLLGWMHLRRALLRVYSTDPSEMLFDAAAAGLKNGNMRTWRSALHVVGRQLQSRSLEPAAAGHLVTNALALEEAAHRQGSEDCKVRLCAAIGRVGSVAMSEQSAETVAKGISSLAERRLGEHRPVLAAVSALDATARGNAVAAVKSIGWLGQHVAAVPPPAAVYGFDADRVEHPTRSLYALLADLAERADRESDGQLNDAIIDACSMIARKLPGSQDRETIETLGLAVGRAGVSAARRYGVGETWHGTHDAVDALVRLHSVLSEIDGEREVASQSAWIAEEVARIGCWVASNRNGLGFESWEGRSDMAVLVAKRLLQLPHEEVGKAFVELIVRQHNSEIPNDNRDEFLGLCQRMSGELLGLGRFLDAPEVSDGEG